MHLKQKIIQKVMKKIKEIDNYNFQYKEMIETETLNLFILNN